MDTEFSVLVHETDTTWRSQGMCEGMTEVFFGPAAERPERRVEREALAKSFCRMCPVMMPCKRSARLNREHGIWGAENDEERAAAGYAPRSPSRRSVIQARDSFKNKTGNFTRLLMDPAEVAAQRNDALIPQAAQAGSDPALTS